MAEKRDPTIVALEAIYAALKDMDPDGRRKVLSSAFALLGVEANPIPFSPKEQGSAPASSYLPVPSSSASSSRPLSLIEVIQEKSPKTNAQRIAVFAYYRERIEGIARFSRGDLKPYFAKAKLSPAANYDRDFGDAVKSGWIHEDGTESYLTTKGIEAIETGFENSRKSTSTKRGNIKPARKQQKR